MPNTYSVESRAVLIIVLLLSGIGLVMVYSAAVNTNPVYAYKQFIWLLIGWAAFFTASRIDYTFYSRHGNLLLAVACLGLVSVFIPAINVSAHGAKRWINILGMTLQPSEFAKITVILYLAAYLARERMFVSEFRGLIKPGIILGVIFCLIVLEPDFGTAVLVETVAFVMIFAIGARLIYAVPVVLASIPFFYLMVVNVAYRRDRVMMFLDPWSDAAGKGYQLVQSLITLGTGSWTGAGLGGGIQKCFFLPEPHTDFIMSVVGEELGLMGTMGLLALYGMLFYYGYLIIRRSPTVLASLTALGIVLMMGLQVIINIAVVTGSCPTKGISLPLVSYGGSSIVCTLFALGILVNIGNQAIDLDLPSTLGARRKETE
ncbi:MAG: putative lipid II flippase FtsW [Planctomycetota bacterium]